MHVSSKTILPTLSYNQVVLTLENWKVVWITRLQQDECIIDGLLQHTNVTISCKQQETKPAASGAYGLQHKCVERDPMPQEGWVRQ